MYPQDVCSDLTEVGDDEEERRGPTSHRQLLLFVRPAAGDRFFNLEDLQEIGSGGYGKVLPLFPPSPRFIDVNFGLGGSDCGPLPQPYPRADERNGHRLPLTSWGR